MAARPIRQGKLLYTTTTEITKLADRYEIGKPKYTIIDLAAAEDRQDRG